MPCLTRTERCEQDLIELWVYIAQDNPAAADRVLDEIHTKCHLLAEHPRLGPARPDLRPDLRYFPVGSYLIRERPISLLVTLSAQAVPAGGETVALKGLVFHHDTVGGLKVISWSHRGLTYALVSSLAKPGHQTCMVCHQGTPDRDFIEHSGPRG